MADMPQEVVASLVIDDAARYLDKLTDDERRPQLIQKKLGPSSRPLSAEEWKAAKEIFGD